MNAGAISVAGMLLEPRILKKCLHMWSRLTTNPRTVLNTPVYNSEQEHADRNRALAYRKSIRFISYSHFLVMREGGTFGEDKDIERVLELYFQLCSIDVNSRELSYVAATLANGESLEKLMPELLTMFVAGTNPMTRERVFSPKSVRDTLSLMFSCGMYDSSGRWAFEIGCPAKSGVSGAIMMVVPNLMGICIWSPRLDPIGNSVRGIQVAKELAQLYNLHTFMTDADHPDAGMDIQKASSLSRKVAYIMELLFAAAENRVTVMERLAELGVDLNSCDYDKRTPLHLAACEGHLEVCQDDALKF